MKLALLAVLLVPCIASAKDSKAKPAAKKEAPVSQSLPLLAPPTGPITVEMAERRIQEFDKSVDTLSADFRQVVRWDETGVEQAIEGTLQYKKPDLLRIEHRLPERQTIVADGQWLWVWRRDTNQVVQTKLDDWRKSEPVAQALLDFGNHSQLLRDYDVTIGTVSAPGADGHRQFELVLKPKSKGAGFSLTLRLSTSDFFPTQTELKAGGVLARSLFTGIRYNPDLKAELFRFTPPADADVFQNFKPPKAE